MNGKTKELFTDYLYKEMVIKGFEQIRFVQQFEKLPASMQFGVIQDWADSVGYEMELDRDNDTRCDWFLFDLDANELGQGFEATRQEARSAAIEKLNDLINEK